MTKPRQNSSNWSCVRRRRNGKCRRANGARRKPSSPSCSKTGSSWHDGQPAPHTRFLIVPDALLTFYDFPAEHWDHLRTSNPIESVFATVRHRTVRTKGSLSPSTARLMVFKLVIAASKTWRRLKGENQLPKIVAGATFRDGTEIVEAPSSRAA